MEKNSDRGQQFNDDERFSFDTDGDTIFIEEDNTIYELDKKCAKRRGMREKREKT